MKPEQQQILITGASGGIGSETARLLSQSGARILAVGRNKTALERLLATLSPHPHQPHQYFCADLNEDSQRRQLLCDLEQQGIKPNVLINLAGTNQLVLFDAQSESEIRRVIDTNLTATLLLTHAVLPVLKQHSNARIINVGSTLGSIGYPGYVSYCTSKFALRGFTEALQRELADGSIRVQYFAPRATRTGLNSEAADRLNSQLNNAVDSPEQVAQQLVAMLRSKASSRFLGWPEKLFVKLNALFPSIVSRAINKQLAVIKQQASAP
ncbi:MAG: short-subunit dehydrogenase [Motiliproteus sp.]|jgi:short-subunit dehydrogenase